MLLLAGLLGILWANSPWQADYHAFFHKPLQLIVFGSSFDVTINLVINDFLMAIFFLLVTLEIKRELLIGQLNSFSKAILPVIAALGGIIVPAILYLAINRHDDIALRGWAIPTATDIAFSLSVLAFIRNHIPRSVRTFLTALAIIDDLGAVIIIAAFYGNQLSWEFFALAFLTCAILFVMSYYQIHHLLPYLVLGFFLWVFILGSGIHPTIAGVLLGFFIPLEGKNRSPLLSLEHHLLPWVNYLILPAFVLANTGISLQQFHVKNLFHPVAIGIIAGLFLGKQIGIFFSSLLAAKIKIAKLPPRMSSHHLYGLSVLSGIGFTMSLFIGDLAFASYHSSYAWYVKLGVLMGSLLSAVIGILLLYFGPKERR